MKNMSVKPIDDTDEKFVFACPVCGKPLSEINRALRCPASHSFDIAASGYVNLLRAQSARVHGDDREMVRARRDFLARGYYSPLADAVARVCADTLAYTDTPACADMLSNAGGGSAGQINRTFTLADLGCGEGFYTQTVAAALRERGARVAAAGFDISRDAVNAAAKAHPHETFAVAGIYTLPVADNYCDLALSIFAPFPESELIRIVRPGGFIVRVLPLERHLWELKRLLYDEPRENDPPTRVERLPLVRQETVEYKIAVAGEDMRNLFLMTPYAHRTSREDAARLGIAEGLEITVSVGIYVYSCINID